MTLEDVKKEFSEWNQTTGAFELNSAQERGWYVECESFIDDGYRAGVVAVQEELTERCEKERANMRDSKSAGYNCPGYNQDLGAHDALAAAIEATQALIPAEVKLAKTPECLTNEIHSSQSETTASGQNLATQHHRWCDFMLSHGDQKVACNCRMNADLVLTPHQIALMEYLTRFYNVTHIWRWS